MVIQKGPHCFPKLQTPTPRTTIHKIGHGLDFASRVYRLFIFEWVGSLHEIRIHRYYDQEKWKTDIIHSSYGSKQIVHYVLKCETHAFSEFDIAFKLKRDFEAIMKVNLTLHMPKDSLRLFKVLLNSSRTARKWLMIDLAMVCEACDEFDIA